MWAENIGIVASWISALGSINYVALWAQCATKRFETSKTNVLCFFSPIFIFLYTSSNKQVICPKDGLIHVAGCWIHSKDDPDQSPKQQNWEVFGHWQLHQWQHWDKPRATNGSYWELHFLTSTRNVLQSISSLEVHLGCTSSSKDRKIHFSKKNVLPFTSMLLMRKRMLGGIQSESLECPCPWKELLY